jgi:hypothetical protein
LLIFESPGTLKQILDTKTQGRKCYAVKLTMNLSGTINTFRLLYAPRLARPHVVLNHFNEVTFPLGRCIAANIKGQHGVDVPEPDIRAVVIDKDNCIAQPHALEVWPAYQVRIAAVMVDCRTNGDS